MVRTSIKLASLAVAAVGMVAASAPVWAAGTTPTAVRVPAAATDPLTMADVAKHASAGDCWTVINGKVYDVTSFIAGHSGGAAVISGMCGKDGTSAFGEAPHGDSYFSNKQVGVIGGAATTTATSTPAPKPSITKLPSAAVSTTAEYTSDDVAKHATAADCWSIVSGKVYNVTEFVTQHPGGATVITGMCGKDSTAAFTGKHKDAADTANKDLALYQVGVVKTATATATATPTATPTATVTQTPTPAATTKAPVVVKKTIKCQNIKTKKITKITAAKPVCPKGTKLVK